MSEKGKDNLLMFILCLAIVVGLAYLAKWCKEHPIKRHSDLKQEIESLKEEIHQNDSLLIEVMRQNNEILFKIKNKEL